MLVQKKIATDHFIRNRSMIESPIRLASLHIPMVHTMEPNGSDKSIILRLLQCPIVLDHRLHKVVYRLTESHDRGKGYQRLANRHPQRGSQPRRSKRRL